MEFLVRMHNDMPPDTPPDRRDELRTAERARAMELRTASILVKLWRVPGSRDAIGLFTAADATELHEALASLPMFPWLTITVEALAAHPQECR
jgi:muconolactone D-isomerase